MANKDLHNEVTEWKRQHAQKLEERKEYFEPQVLKIDDTESLKSLSDMENDLDDDYVKVNSLAAGLASDSTASFQSRPLRAKSAFKQSFDYAVDVPQLDTEVIIEKTRQRSMSRDKKSASSSLNRKLERDDSDLRLTTGNLDLFVNISINILLKVKYL